NSWRGQLKHKLAAAALANNSLPIGDHWDARQAGLILRVQKRRRTWFFRFRQGGKNPRIRLGYFPALSLSAPREAAAELGKRVDAGVPVSPAPSAQHPRSGSVATLRDRLDQFEALRRREGGRIKNLNHAMATV